MHQHWSLLKRLLSTAATVVILGVLLSGSAFAAQPNVLMIVVDDMNDWVGCLGGHPDVKTPNIDRLAARGMLFANAHCAAPVCNASRVATLTGRRPGSTGIYDNSARWHEAYSRTSRRFHSTSRQTDITWWVAARCITTCRASTGLATGTTILIKCSMVITRTDCIAASMSATSASRMVFRSMDYRVSKH